MTRPYWPHSDPSEPRHTMGVIPTGRTYKAEQALQPVHIAVPPAPCLNGCKQSSPTGTEPALVEHPARICNACRKRLDGWLATIPTTFALLLYVIDHGTVTGNPDSAHTKQPDPPAPMRLEVTDLLDVRPGRGVLGLMHGWAQTVRDERHLSTVADTAVKVTVAGECALLGSNLPWILQQPWVSEMYAEVKPLVRRMQDAVGDYRPARLGMCVELVARPNVPVDAPCGGSLFRDKTGDGIHCVSCGHRTPLEEFSRLGLLIGLISDNGDVSSREAS